MADEMNAGMRSILANLDGSPRAPSVLRAAVALARAAGAKVWLFRAVGLPAEVPPEAYSMTPDALRGLLEKRARGDLEELGRQVPPDLLAGQRVALGTPWQSICQTAKELDVDLIVVGSHGYAMLDRLLGTTAAKVVNHADRSVLVVREPRSAEEVR